MADFKNRYNKKNYDRIVILVPKGKGDEINKIAGEQGLSRNKYIAKCIEEKSGLNLSLDKEAPWLKFQGEEGVDDSGDN